MSKCHHILIFLLLFSCISVEQKTNLNDELDRLYKEGLFNGAILVTENSKVIISEGFGYANFDLQTPFGTDTAMDTGSISKTFTAFAIITLADSLKIDLNTAVNNFIEEFPYNSITLNHLLRQTSGLVSDDYVFDRVQKGTDLTNTIFLDYLINDKPKLEFTPGSKFEYNGFNHILLAIVIEKISKVSYEKFIKEKITDPLVMTDWFLRPSRLSHFPVDRAIGYSIENDSIKINDSDDYEAFYGDCNLFFSAQDLSKWSNSFISNSLYPEEKLSKALNMKSDLSDFNILHWYNLENEGKYHFTGDWKGFYTMVYFDYRQKRSIVYLSNTNLAYWLRPALVRNINSFLDNNHISDWERPRSIKLETADIIGDYQIDKSRVISIAENMGQLKIQIDNQNSVLFKLDQNFYYAPGIDLWIWFTKDDDENLKIHCSSIYSLTTALKNSD